MTPEEVQKIAEQLDALRNTDPAGCVERATRLIHDAEAAREDLHLAKFLVLRAKANRSIWKFDGAVADLLRAKNLYAFFNDIAGLAVVTNGLGLLAKDRGQLHEAKAHLEEALGFSAKANDFDSEIRVCLNLASLCSTIGEFDAAMRYTEQARIREKGTPLEGWSLLALANLLAVCGQYYEAIELLTECLTSTISTNNLYFANQVLGNIGAAFTDLKKHDEAYPYLLRSLEGHLATNNKTSQLLGYINVGRCLAELHRFDEAINYLDLAILLANKKGDDYWVIMSRIIYAYVLTLNGNAAGALEYIEQVSTLEGFEEHSKDSHNVLAKIYRQVGNTEKALYHLVEHDRLAEQIHISEAARRIKAANAVIALEREKNAFALQKLRTETAEQQLAGSTAQLVAQTELLKDIRLRLADVIRIISPSDPVVPHLQKILKNIPCNQVDWERFDMQFKAAHPEFTKKLLDRHPTLTPMQVRICCLLRMNLRSEEIAQLLCVTDRAVEFHRLNVRKKMNLAKSDNLSLVLAKM